MLSSSPLTPMTLAPVMRPVVVCPVNVVSEPAYRAVETRLPAEQRSPAREPLAARNVPTPVETPAYNKTHQIRVMAAMVMYQALPY